MRRIAVCLAIVMLCGCVTAPQMFQVNNVRQYPVSKDVLWDRVIRYFATSNIQVKTVAKDSGVIYAERLITGSVPTEWSARGRIGDLADCGKDFMAIPAAQAMQFNVYVRELGAGLSSATVTVTYVESYQGMNTMYGYYEPPPAVNCNSTGVLEGKVLDFISRP